MANTTVVNELPIATERPIAMTRLGNTTNASIILIKILSIGPLKWTEISPKGTPIRTDRIIAPKLTIKAIRDPYINLERVSRPI